MEDHQRIHPAHDAEAPQKPMALLMPSGSSKSDKGNPAEEYPPFYRTIPVMYSKPPKRRSCCFKCFCWTTRLLILLIVIIAIVTAVIYVVFQPKIPKYSVDSMRITQFNLNNDTSLSTTFNLNITATNPNKKIGIYYEHGSHISTWYTDTQLCQGFLPKFYQSHQNVTAVEVLVAAGVTVVLGVGNRVLYKLALVPLKHYPFFLAQLATFGYVIVYFSILYLRYHAGIVTDEMLSLPKAPFLAVGLLEALGAAAGMAAGAILSGAAIPILSQSFLVWQLLLSYIFLGRRYRFNQLLGCSLVAVGVIITVASGSSAGSLMEGGVFWSLLMIVSFLFQAADTVLKEVIFLNAAQQLKGRTVDLFVVNSYGSAFQALFIFLLLPFLSKLWGIPFYQLPNYLKDGAACFLNNGTISIGCDGAPLLPLLFVIVNMGFNISLLHLIKISSAVVSCLASTVSVPISVFLFTLPLPYLGVASSLPPGFVTGAVVLLVGMLIYGLTPLLTPSSTDPQPSVD